MKKRVITRLLALVLSCVMGFSLISGVLADGDLTSVNSGEYYGNSGAVREDGSSLAGSYTVKSGGAVGFNNASDTVTVNDSLGGNVNDVTNPAVSFYADYGIECNLGTVVVNSGTLVTNEQTGTVITNNRTVTENNGTVTNNYGITRKAQAGYDAATGSLILTSGTDDFVGVCYTGEADDKYLDQWNETADAAGYTLRTASELGFNAPRNKKMTGWLGNDGVTYQVGDLYAATDTPLTLTAQWKDFLFFKAIGSGEAGNSAFTLSDATANKFLRLKVDGKTVANENNENYVLAYDSATGLTLTFTDAFLAALSAGEHNVEMDFSNGYSLFTLAK